MSLRKPDLQSLRKIGFALWDPIGLADEYDNGRGTFVADEYDRYLLKSFEMAKGNASLNVIAEYLCWVHSVHMGLSGQTMPTTNELNTAQAILDLAHRSRLH